MLLLGWTYFVGRAGRQKNREIGTRNLEDHSETPAAKAHDEGRTCAEDEWFGDLRLRVSGAHGEVRLRLLCWLMSRWRRRSVDRLFQKRVTNNYSS
jgi:hypothetical protein